MHQTTVSRCNCFEMSLGVGLPGLGTTAAQCSERCRDGVMQPQPNAVSK